MTAPETIVRAGIWLIRNGYGQLALLPYASSSGAYWRCEFHPQGRPSQTFYRYSTADGFRYLANHCGGAVRADVGPRKLGEAIMVSVPAVVRAQCAGQPTGAMQRWLVLLEQFLDRGCIPQAFHGYSEDTSRWDLVVPEGAVSDTMRPQPGYVAPGMANPPDEPSHRTWAVSRTAPADAPLRRAQRLLAMIHELHKAGFQRLRVCVGMSADDVEWRCHLAAAAAVSADGWTPLNTEQVPVYSTRESANYFDWTDCAGDDARALAVKFIERLPEMAAACAGPDWAYAGWFTAVLGAAEHGHLPALYGGIDFSPGLGATALPPPVPDWCGHMSSSDDGDELLDDAELELHHLPPPSASYDEVWRFCLTYDGSRRGLRTIDDCFHVADTAFRDGLQRATIANLRTAAFIHQRRLKWQDLEPIKQSDVSPIYAVVEELRRRLS